MVIVEIFCDRPSGRIHILEYKEYTANLKMPIETQIGVSPFVVLPGVDLPVKIITLGPNSKLDLRYYTQDPTNNVVDIDDSRVINQVKAALRSAKSNAFTELVRSQPLFGDGRAGQRSLARVLSQYKSKSDGIVVAEMLDLTPKVRFPGLKLPDKDHRSVIYRGRWKVLPGYPGHAVYRHELPDFLDVSEMDPGEDLVPVSLSYTDQVKREWQEITGAPSHSNINKRSLKHSRTRRSVNDLLQLGWDNQKLSLRGAPNHYYFNHYAVLGSLLSIDELLEQYIQTQEDRMERAEPFIRKHGFEPTEHLSFILTSQPEDVWEKELEIWERALAETREGNFNINDQLQLDLEFTRYRQFTGKSYKAFEGEVVKVARQAEDGQLPESHLGIGLSDRREAALTAYEALLLLDYLQTLSAAALDSGRRLVILENKSNGVYSVEPIKDFLDPIEVIQCYISSGGSEGFIPKRMEQLIDGEKPWLAFVDGTNNVASLGQSPRSMGLFRIYLQGKSPDYQFKHWNADRVAADYLTSGKPAAVFEPPQSIADPVGILIVSSVSDSNIPELLKKQVSLGDNVFVHKPASFDDWPQKDQKEAYFDRFGLQTVSALEMLLDSISTAVRGYRQDGRIMAEIASRRIQN